MNCLQLQFTKRIIKLKNARLQVLALEDLLIFNFEMFSDFLIPVVLFYYYIGCGKLPGSLFSIGREHYSK